MNTLSSSAYIKGQPRQLHATLALVLGLVGGLAVETRADLLVLNSAGSASYVLRLDAATGTPVATFRHDTEAYYSMTLSPLNEICISSNTLGEYSLQVFGEDRHYRGDVGRNQTGLFGGTRGPDGAIYALAPDEPGSAETISIVRIDTAGATRFVPNGTGGMTRPVCFVFGPDGELYVGDARAGVLRFSGGHSGVSRGVLVPLGNGGLQDVSKLMFGPDGRLYVASHRLNAVLRFDRETGAAIDTFVPAGSGGLVSPAGMAFGPDGHLYVTSAGTNQILRFDGRTGAALGVFAAASGVPGDPKIRWSDLVFETQLPLAGAGSRGSSEVPAGAG